MSLTKRIGAAFVGLRFAPFNLPVLGALGGILP
jgi:hypothetical protein